MTHEDWTWISQNRTILYSSLRMTKEQGQKIFEIYNRLSPKRMEFTTCGSCVRTVINLLKQEYEKYTNNL
jgi:hypothetical protein